MELRYLVTGTGRSGTVFMARFLTSVGIPCTHEGVFNLDGLEVARQRLRGELPIKTSDVSTHQHHPDGTFTPLEPWLGDDPLFADSSMFAMSFLRMRELRRTKIIHVVRNPIDVVRSTCDYVVGTGGGYDPGASFIFKYAPFLNVELPRYDWTCLWWMHWNLMTNKCSIAYRHRVEDDPLKLLQFLGKADYYDSRFRDTTINSFRRPTTETFSLDKIKNRRIAAQFVKVGRSYGYPMKDA